MLTIFLIFVATYLFYKWSTSTYDFFEKQGIAFNKPWPLIGSNSNLFFNRKPMAEDLNKWYYEFENEKLSGLFEFRQPIVMIRDPQIIKQLIVKDFDYFMDHRVLVTEDIDPFFGNNLFSLSGQKWRDMRATLSPAFTGSKMRQMFDFVSVVGIQTVQTLKKDIEAGKESIFEFTEFASKFTCDNIASCAFGIEVNSFANPSNDFFKIASKITNFGVKAVLKFVGYMIFPKVMKALKICLLDKETVEFFKCAIYDTMKTRERLGIVRKDMIQLIMDAKKGKLTHDNNNDEKILDGYATVDESHIGQSVSKRQWSDVDLAAQCFIFFVAGFHSVATAMSFLAYELACNPDVQQQLFEEITEKFNEIDGQKLNYEQLQSMKYMDQVISEVLRKWPAPMLDRLCVKDYELKFDEKTLKFHKNMFFVIPSWSIHRNPKYYPNPEKFDPERFNDENKHKIEDFTYMPFGAGPRNCIGSRFALMEIKALIFYLLLNFSIEVTEKTQIPLKFVKIPIQMKPEKGIWVALRPRIS